MLMKGLVIFRFYNCLDLLGSMYFSYCWNINCICWLPRIFSSSNYATLKIHSLLVSLLLIWIIVFLNIRSLENSSKFQLVTTLLKLLPLIFIILLGASNFNTANLPELNPSNLHPISLIATVTTLVMWSFIGIETATVPAENVINPQETIPKVLIASVLTILILYILVSIAIAALVPASELINSSAPFALAATKILGVTGGTIISIGALISTLGSLNANTLTAGNLSLAAARDGSASSKICNFK